MSNKAFKIYLKEKSDEMFKSNQTFVLRNNNHFIKQCRQEWKSMTDFQHKPYEEKVGNQMEINCNVFNIENQNKMDVCVEKSKQITEVIENKMIEAMVAKKSREELMSNKFYLMSSNVLCKCNDTYIPLEIGFVEYAIGRGILNTYHEFIDFGDIPVGYSYTAISHSNNCHKIPLKNFALASNQFNRIVNQIEEMLAESRVKHEIKSNFTSMIVFSDKEQIEQNYGVFQWLSNKYNEEMRKNNIHSKFEFEVKVVDIALLVRQTFAELLIPRPMPAIVNDLTSCAFDYSKDTDCQYHRVIQCIECAIGVAKRLSYNISNCFQQILKFEITPQHFPQIKLNSNDLNAIEVKIEKLEIKDSEQNSSQTNGSEDKKKPNIDSFESKQMVSRVVPKNQLIGIGRGSKWFDRK